MTHWMTWIARAVAFVTLFLPEEAAVNAFMCSENEGSSSVAEAYASSKYVFKGRVVRIDGEYDPEDDPDVTVKLRVLKNYKGADSRYVTVTTNYPDYGGFYFQKRRNYLVYTDGYVSMCSYTKKASRKKTKKEQRQLNKLSRNSSRRFLMSSPQDIGDENMKDTGASNADDSISLP